MQCEEFLEGYSEFLDGRLGKERRAAFEAHREACCICGRYDRVVQRGLSVWRNLPDIDPSPDFLPRLRHRLYHVDDEAHLSQSRHVGSAALIAVAAVGMLALAWLPFATRMTVEVELPPLAVEAPADVSGTLGPTYRSPARSGWRVYDASLFGSGPFVTPAFATRTAASRRSPSAPAQELFFGSGWYPVPVATWSEASPAGSSSAGSPR